VLLSRYQNRLVLVCTNLQPAQLRGVTSEGMILAATKRFVPLSPHLVFCFVVSFSKHLASENRDKKEIQGLDLVNPPEGAKIGETVFFEGDSSGPDRPTISNQRLKKLIKVHPTNAISRSRY